MKKKLISIAMILMLLIAFAACGQAPAENEDGGSQDAAGDVNGAEADVDADAAEPGAYDELIAQIRGEIEAGTLEESQREGAYSLYVGFEPLGGEALTAAGYTLLDVNHDGTEELVIGIRGDSTILNLYTLSGGEPVLVFEGFARNAYSVIGGGQFGFHGSSSAASSAFGTYVLPAGGTKLECVEFWFSDIKPDTDMEIGFYYNTTGQWDAAASEELTISEEEFWNLNGEIVERAAVLEYTPFAG